MSRIATPAVETATGATADIYAKIRKAVGRVPNAYAAIGAINPAALASTLQAGAVLSAGSLSKQDEETIKIVVSEIAGCDYCVAAHAAVGKMVGLKPEAIRQIRAGESTGDAKRDALVRFVRVLQTTRGTIPAAELEAVKAAGYSDAQLVDVALAIALITFTNVFNRFNDTDVDFPAVE
ncbi:carboxymuconolactone decarboxylase family protein [Bordetella bronchialis]|uniref:Alkylhydroperoxidase n=1 Tax=Bordetella bronchialis TaxID=463025 RepID=A0A193FQA4_9BORD|nr:carboxymuconolactone decarboxylase family protein [Bordetella bronchialis]ANN69264.1 alkylhydroperoxidase [Bordetella bronchialis]ANN74415.1 alkylhydroperoxidase [Bordetella bronchialis]